MNKSINESETKLPSTATVELCSTVPIVSYR